MTLNGLELTLLSARLNLILKKTSEKQKQKKQTKNTIESPSYVLAHLRSISSLSKTPKNSIKQKRPLT